MVTERNLSNQNETTGGTNASRQSLQDHIVMSTLHMHGKVSGFLRGGDEPYRGELTLQSAGIDKAAAVSHNPLIVRSTPWLMITIQK